MKDRRFIFWLAIIIIAGLEVFTMRAFMTSDASYGQNILNAEFQHYVSLVGADKSGIVHSVLDKIKNFMYTGLHGKEKLYEMVMDTFALPVFLFVIRGLSLLYALPLMLVGLILGVSEGYISHHKKAEIFRVKSTMAFHLFLRFSSLIFFAMLVGYMLSPMAVNPFLMIYSYGLIAYILTNKIVSNFPAGNI